MDVIRIQGGVALEGTVQISGSKNAALPIFAATLLTDEPCILDNIPNLSDIKFMTEILKHLGATVECLSPNSWKVQAKKIDSVAPYELVRKMRASVCLLGPLVGRLRKAEVSLPGGCIIGQRPIDLHLKGLTKLGCEIRIENGYVYVDGSKMRGALLFLGGRYGSTALGTANLVMAAVLAPGTTRIESAACEPEIIDLCRMLLSMGARIEGIGSHTLTIHGVQKLKGCKHTVISDRIEAGSYLIAGVATRGRVTVKGVSSEYLGSLLHKFEEMGVSVSLADDITITVNAKGLSSFKPVEIITLPYPGYPTDLQAQMCALMAITPGLSIITERVFPNRFMHIPELQRMGADISLEGSSAIIHGKRRLSGAPVMASDLRASASLIIGGLAAEGETWVQRIYHLDRGYENLHIKFAQLGAQMDRMPANTMPLHYQILE
jgi:UDP-N-acetylglucosamine 1-carboxyvinyltransferase